MINNKTRCTECKLLYWKKHNYCYCICCRKKKSLDNNKWCNECNNSLDEHLEGSEYDD